MSNAAPSVCTLKVARSRWNGTWRLEQSASRQTRRAAEHCQQAGRRLGHLEDVQSDVAAGGAFPGEVAKEVVQVVEDTIHAVKYRLNPAAAYYENVSWDMRYRSIK